MYSLCMDLSPIMVVGHVVFVACPPETFQCVDQDLAVTAARWHTLSGSDSLGNDPGLFHGQLQVVVPAAGSRPAGCHDVIHFSHPPDRSAV